MDKISIVTVTYNCRQDAEKTVQHLLSLDYPDYELIVVDGASTDGTVEVLDRYRTGFAYFISEPDNGIYDAMNKGLAQASGEWVIFLNAGDFFDGKDVMKRVFEKDWSGVDVIYGYGRVITDGGVYDDMPTPFWRSAARIHGVGICHQSVFVRTALARQYGFDTSYRCCADYNMLANIYKNGGNFQYCNLSVSLCEVRYGYSVKNKLRLLKEEAWVCGERNSLYFWLWYSKKTAAYFFFRLKQSLV